MHRERFSTPPASPVRNTKPNSVRIESLKVTLKVHRVEVRPREDPEMSQSLSFTSAE